MILDEEYADIEIEDRKKVEGLFKGGLDPKEELSASEDIQDIIEEVSELSEVFETHERIQDLANAIGFPGIEKPKQS